MNEKRIDVLGVGFDNFTMEEAVDEGVRLMNEPGAHYVVTPNPEIVEICREDADARGAVNSADLVIPDGIGVIYGAKILGTPLKQKLPGIEFAERLMEKMAQEKKTLYLLGAKPGIAEQAAEKLPPEKHWRCPSPWASMTIRALHCAAWAMPVPTAAPPVM